MSIDIFQKNFWNKTFEQDFDNWVTTLPVEQSEAIHMYVYHEHKTINVALHTGVENDYATNLNKAVQDGRTLNGTFFRGGSRIPNVTVGDTYSNEAFMSTSLNPHIAAKFMGKNGSKVFYQIDSIKGGLPVVSNMNEDEILLGVNNEFVVKNIVHNTDIKIFYPETDYSITHENVTFVHLTQ